jgi:hypothetical protein
MDKVIDQETLSELLNYDKVTGKLYWKERDAKWFDGNIAITKMWNSQNFGREAFTAKDRSGYYVGHIFNVRYYAHRIIWILVYGNTPDEIDHINGKPSDNSIANLKASNSKQNKKNRKMPNTNKSGVTGIRQTKSGKYSVTLRVNGKPKQFGCYESIEEAKETIQTLRKVYGYSDRHGT